MKFLKSATDKNEFMQKRQNKQVKEMKFFDSDSGETVAAFTCDNCKHSFIYFKTTYIKEFGRYVPCCPKCSVNILQYGFTPLV